MKIRLSFLIVICLCLSGCETPQGKSAGEGAAIGGAALGIGCLLLGGNSRDCAALAAAGAVAGAAIAYSYADNVEKKRKQLAGKENDLNARLAYVKDLNRDTEKLNKDLAMQLDANTKKTAELNARINQGKITSSQLAKERKDLDDQAKAAEKQLSTAERELADMKRFRAQRTTQSAALDAEIARLELLLSDARRDTTALASLSRRI